MRDQIITLLAVVVVVLGTSTIAFIYYDEWRGEPGLGDAIAEYEDGNYRSAFALFLQLAQDGSLEAQRYLARQYENGEGTDRNMVEAFHWRLRLADHGDAYSMFWVGRSYHLGNGTAPNLERTLHWYRRAVQLGQVDAQSLLGVMLVFGEGQPANPEKGLPMMMNAIEAGDAWAMAMLGTAHRDGHLGTPNMQQALRWCLASTRAGHVAGYECAVELLSNEKRPTFDLEQAYVWSLVARHWWRSDAERISQLDREIREMLRHPPAWPDRRAPITGATERISGDSSGGDIPEDWAEYARRYRDFESWPVRLEETVRLRAEATADDIIARWPEPPITDDACCQ